MVRLERLADYVPQCSFHRLLGYDTVRSGMLVLTNSNHKARKIRVTTVKISTVLRVGDHLLRRLRGGSPDDHSMNFHRYGKLTYRV
jgi:hypothetical protein